MRTTLAMQETMLPAVQPRAARRCERAAPARGEPMLPPVCLRGKSRSEVIAVIQAVEGEPVEKPPMIFKLAVLFGTCVIGLGALRLSLVIAVLTGSVIH